MSMTDPIADMLTRVRNAMAARHAACEIPASAVKESILKIIKEAGYIRGFSRKTNDDGFETLVVDLKYVGKERNPMISELRRVSKPGCRVYRGYRDIKPLMAGVGFSILSTPKGILRDSDAITQKVGGEVICQVW